MIVFSQLESFGQLTLNQLERFGRFARFCAQVFWWLVCGVKQWCRFDLIAAQLYNIGTRSTPVVMLLGLFIGMVLAIETFAQFQTLGQETIIGAVINISVIRQIGPVLAAIMLAGRVGSSVSAELGTMHVTEQLDAMRVMGVDPIAYLVVPRIIACVLMIPALTIFSDITGIVGGYLITVKGFGVNSEAYLQRSADFIYVYDMATGLVKSMFFGLAIGLVSCYKGFHCKAGAAGVGRAATDSFVSSFVAIIISNFFLAKLLNDLFYVIYGYVASSLI